MQILFKRIALFEDIFKDENIEKYIKRLQKYQRSI